MSGYDGMFESQYPPPPEWFRPKEHKTLEESVLSHYLQRERFRLVQWFENIEENVSLENGRNFLGGSDE